MTEDLGEGAASEADIDLEKAERALRELPDAFWSTPELRHIQQAAHAGFVNPVAVLGCVLACLAADVHPRVRTPVVIGTPGSLNLVVVACGPTGTGKSQAVRIAQELIGQPRASIAEPSSGEGLINAYRRFEKDDRDRAPQDHKVEVWHTRGVLAITDEVSALAGVADRKSNTLLARLRSLITGEYVGTANATPERNRTLPANGYSLGYVIGAQPGAAEVLLGADAVITGLAGRLIGVPTILGEPVHGVSDPGPLRINWPDEVRLDPVGDREERYLARPDGLIVMTADEVVKDEVLPVLIATKQGKLPSSSGHQAYVRIKVASLLALLGGRTDVTADDWAKAGDVMAVSAQTLEYMVMNERERNVRTAASRGVADARRDDARDAERLRMTATRLSMTPDSHAADSQRCKGRPRHDGCTKACLTGAVPKADRPRLNDAIDLALDNGWLLAEDRDSASSRPSETVRIYRARG